MRWIKPLELITIGVIKAFKFIEIARLQKAATHISLKLNSFVIFKRDKGAVICDLQTVYFKLWTVSYQLWAVNIQQWSVKYELCAVNYDQWTVND